MVQLVGRLPALILWSGLVMLSAFSVGCRKPAPPPAPVGVAAPPVVLPPLPAATSVAPGIVVHQVQLPYGQSGQKVWIYLPEKPEGKLPCVLIAPAGSPLVIGMALAEGDRAEHLPYVRAGFAVVAYELDGRVPKLETATNDQICDAAKRFMKANFGVDNARQALDYALANVPALDAQRIYAAGHSSAATLALTLTEHERRVKACAAYAGVTDSLKWMKERNSDLAALLSRSVIGFDTFFRDSSPLSNTDWLDRPLFLFCADDDTVVLPSESISFAEVVRKKNPRVTLVRVPTGGHYNSMIKEGIPQAIRWLQELPKR